MVLTAGVVPVATVQTSGSDQTTPIPQSRLERFKETVHVGVATVDVDTFFPVMRVAMEVGMGSILVWRQSIFHLHQAVGAVAQPG